MRVNIDCYRIRFSALQRAEIAEMWFAALLNERGVRCFSALQRAEIAEMRRKTTR